MLRVRQGQQAPQALRVQQEPQEPQEPQAPQGRMVLMEPTVLMEHKALRVQRGQQALKAPQVKACLRVAQQVRYWRR